MSVHFEYPLAFTLLLLIPCVLAWKAWRGSAPVMVVPYAGFWSARRPRPQSLLRLSLLCLALVFLVVAIARPQSFERRDEVVSRGYDLILAVDLSTSMLAEDYAGPDGPINRLEAIRPVIRAFVRGRPNDRIGVVVFAARAYTLAPLTTDHPWLDKKVADLRIGMLEDGTAIGDGLGIALANLERECDPGATCAGRFVVLLTDGANTSGSLTPPQSTAIARHRAVPVYTVGAGRNGLVPFPVFDDSGRRIGTRQFPSSLDIESLRTMSAATMGQFLQAGDVSALNAAFKTIDKAAKNEFSVRTRSTTRELFAWPLGLALALLLTAAPVWSLIHRAKRRTPL